VVAQLYDASANSTLGRLKIVRLRNVKGCSTTAPNRAPGAGVMLRYADEDARLSRAKEASGAIRAITLAPARQCCSFRALRQAHRHSLRVVGMFIRKLCGA
jgi:hypothetical protein